MLANLGLVNELSLSGEVVHPGEGGVSGGQLEGLLDSGNSGDSWGTDDSAGISGWGETGEGSGGDELGGPPLALLGGGGGLGVGGEVLGSGGGDLGGDLNWGWGDSSVDGGDWEDWVEDGSHGQVGGLDTESGSVSDILGVLEDTVGVNVAPSTVPHASPGVALLAPGAVGVAVTKSQVAELILGVELLGVGSSWDSGHRGGGGDWGNWGHGGGQGGGGQGGGHATEVGAGVGSVKEDLSVGGGGQGSNNSDKSLHFGDLMRIV